MNTCEKYYTDCQTTLDKALTSVPFYSHWKRIDPGSGKSVDERYRAFPALTKKDITANFPDGFVPTERNVDSGLSAGEILYVKTSGTTSDAVTNIWNQQWWDASYRSSWQYNSHFNSLLKAGTKEAVLGSPVSVGFYADDNSLPMEKRILRNMLFLNEKKNPAFFTDEHMERIVDELGRYQPVVLEVNPSFMNVVCRYINRKGLKPWKPELITYTYENASLLHLREIKQAFPGVPLASSYGTTETGYVFTECEQGRLHQNRDYCRVDFQPFKPEHGGPLLGRILVTTFHNPWYMLLRFTVGDIVRLEESQTCPCGRHGGLLLASVQGRFHDCTLTTNGRLVTAKAVDECLAAVPGLSGYQLTQLTPDRYRVAFTLSPGSGTETTEAGIKSALKKLYGAGASIDTELKAYLEPENNGKYRLVSSMLPMCIEDYLPEQTGGQP